MPLFSVFGSLLKHKFSKVKCFKNTISKYFLLFFLQSSNLCYSQQWLGISSSNYSGTYGIYQNPANVVDSRFKVFLNLGGGNADFVNNYAGWDAPYSLISMATNSVKQQFRGPGGLILFRNSYVKQASQRENSTAFLGAEARTPSFMYQLNKSKIGFGLTSRARVLANITKLSPIIGKILVEGTRIPTLYGVVQTDNHFNFNLNGYTELAFSLGFVLKEQDQDFLKLGITGKRLNGMWNTHILAKDLDFKITQHPTRPNRQNIDITNAEGTFGLVSEDAIAGFGFSPDWLVGTLPPGIGYGVDIGFVYEFRPDFDKYDIRLRGKWTTDATKNKYKYRFGVALLDIGQLKFSKGNFTRTGLINKTNINIPPGTYTKITTADKLYIAFNQNFSVPESNYRNIYTVALPTSLSVSFDYKFSEKIYFNTFLVQNLQNTKSKAMIQPSMFAFVPRYETKWFEFSIPISLHNNYKNLTLGIAGRVGGFFLGSDNLGGFFKVGSPKGISAYAGLFLPIFQKLPKNPNECYSENAAGVFDKLKNKNSKNKQKRRWKRIG